jgi:hypothetical protein
MKVLMRVVVAFGVLGGIAWVLYRFGPEMMEQCREMMGEDDRFGDEVTETIEEELAAAEV